MCRFHSTNIFPKSWCIGLTTTKHFVSSCPICKWTRVSSFHRLPCLGVTLAAEQPINRVPRRRPLMITMMIAQFPL